MKRIYQQSFFLLALLANIRWSAVVSFVCRGRYESALSKKWANPPVVGHLGHGHSTERFHMATISPGDSVLVIGGTGGVGQLTLAKLDQKGFVVRTTSRDKVRAKETVSNENVSVYQVDLLSKDTSALMTAMDGVSAVVISVGTTAFPTMKWRGGNTPAAIDDEAVTRIANVAFQKCNQLKKIVLVTSVGIERTSDMPFVILNLFGVLDAKRKGEEAVMAAATRGGFDYTIVRPGRLVGGPFTNYDVANLLKIEGGAENGVALAAGDTLLGDCKRDACAEAIVQALTNEESGNKVLSIISTEEKALTNEQWTDAFHNL
jgi:uncharacterized protein YbjT (DUF2867 family)